MECSSPWTAVEDAGHPKCGHPQDPFIQQAQPATGDRAAPGLGGHKRACGGFCGLESTAQRQRRLRRGVEPTSSHSQQPGLQLGGRLGHSGAELVTGPCRVFAW